ncbi:MAG: hypothetical protein V4543_11695 [Bacteroidota bacterium]
MSAISWFVYKRKEIELFWYRQTGRQPISETRRRRQARILKILTFPALLAAVAVLILSFAGAALYIWAYYPSDSFSVSAWNEYPDKRYQLTEDLTEHYKLIGLSEAEVRAMLGKETVNGDGTWFYDIGMKPGLDAGPYVLKLYLKEGKVRRAEEQNTSNF